MTFAKYLVSPVMAIIMTGMGSVSNLSKMTVTVVASDKQPIPLESVEPPSTIPDVISTVTRPEEPAKPQTNQEIVRTFCIAEFGEDQVNALFTLVQKESGFQNNVKNKHSTAYGMFQFLDSTWNSYGFTKTSDPIVQAQAGMAYIKARYGTPANALKFHRANNWY